MDHRFEFVQAALRGALPFAELCRRWGISRQNGYKWLARFREAGRKGLEDQSRAPKVSPQVTPPELRNLILAARREHPTWGPKKLAAELARRHPSAAWPAPSTIGDLLKREGLVRPRKLRHTVPPYQHPFLGYTQPNDVWCIDFKGQFLLRGGEYCYPLTVTDGCSRFLLGCRALPGIHEAPARKALERLFREYGLPRALRSDNGPPFASALAVCGLSSLAVWVVRLGIRPERIEPGCPWQNGRHERMHRTLKAETTRPPSETQAGQQRVFDRFRKEFNEQRPHEALGMKVPAAVYRTSPRSYPERLPELEYPSWSHVRKVDCNGCISMNAAQVFVGRTLARECVGLEPTDTDGHWVVRFGGVEIGLLDERTNKLEKLGIRWREAH